MAMTTEPEVEAAEVAEEEAVEVAAAAAVAAARGRRQQPRCELLREREMRRAIATTLLAHACGCLCVGARLCFCL